MRKLLGLCLFVPLVICGTAVAQGTPDGETPANEGVCDELLLATPGLYGLCIAFCEAQDCGATFDATTGEVTFDPSCKPSNPKLLDNYSKRKTAVDPPMPCVNIAVAECPCWADAEIEPPFAETDPTCPPISAALIGFGQFGDNFAASRFDATSLEFSCFFTKATGSGPVTRQLVLTEGEHLACVQSIADECSLRGL